MTSSLFSSYVFALFTVPQDSPIEQVAYQRILQLSYVDELLSALRTLFVKMFEPFLAAFVASLHAVNSAKVATFGTGEAASSWNFANAFKDWDNVFDKLLNSLETKAAQVSLFTHFPSCLC